MKKILFFTDAFSGGGAEEVMNFYSDKLNDSYDVLHLAKWKGPKKINLPDWKKSLNKKSSKECLPELYTYIKNFKPDVIISATGHNNILILILKIIFFNRFKVIIRESSVASEMKKFSLKSILIDTFFVKPLYKTSDKIIAQSEDMYNDLIEHYRVKPSKLVVINNPIINKLQKKNKINKASKEIVLLCIGRFSKEKGHLRLLDILSKLPENYSLKLMGDGILKKEIFNYAKKIGVERRVEFLGFLEENEKIEAIKNADVYVQTSFVEGFPNSLLQAVSYGLPVIAYNVKGGTREIINDFNGILIKDDDKYEFAQKLIKTDWKSFDSSLMIKDVYNRFSEEAIINKIKHLIHHELQ